MALVQALPTISIQRIVLIVMFVYWRKYHREKRRMSDIPFMNILILISIASLISSLCSSYLLVSFKRFLYYFTESILFFYILVTSITNKKMAVCALTSVCISLSCLSVLGVIEKSTGFNPSNLFHGTGVSYEFRQNWVQQNLGRSSISGVESTFEHRILFGYGMSIAIIYFMYFLEFAKRKWIYWVLISFAGASLYFSMSRGPWLGLIGAIAFAVFLSPKVYTKRILVLLILVLCGFAARPGALQTIQRLANNTFDQNTVKGSSFNWRTIVLEKALEKVTSGPLIRTMFGYGQGSRHFLDFGTATLSTGHFSAFDSWDMEYAVLILEQGFIGIILIIYLSVYAMAKSIVFAYYHPEVRQFVIFLLVCISIFAYMKTNVKIFAPQLVYLEYFTYALVSLILSRSIIIDDLSIEYEQKQAD
jgi:hypothetical protein